ncbi:MAG: TonB-dependent receptor [Muribaculaceae bacterium]|nr:TonB-dependent receptor [Muribaculaceae bacterium]
MKTHLLKILLFLFGVASVYAQEKNDTTALSELLVTAPSKTQVALTPMDVTIVTSEEIEKSTESSLLPVLQNHVPGFFVSERGMEGYGVSGGAAGSVTIRGVGSGTGVLFMIDGVPTWAGVFGHSVADTYSANGVEKVEVVKGPSSLLYGSNAMGGSVNIITKKHNAEGFSGRARAMYGFYNTVKLNLSGGYRKNKFSVMAAAQYDRSDNNRPGSAFWLWSEYANLQYSASRHWSVGATVDMTQSKAHNPGSTYDPLENMWTKIARGSAAVYAHNSYSKVNGGVQAYINWGKHHLDDGNAPGTRENNYYFNLTDYNMGFNIFETVNPWRGNDLSLGVDFQHWGGHIWNDPKEGVYNPATDGEFNPSEERKHENDIAGYIMMQQGFFHNILSLNAGVRLQHNSRWGNIWIPQAGFIVRPVNQSELKFSFSKGFHSPSIKDMYLFPPKNPNLKPEYLYNYELSYRQTVCNGMLNFGAAIYYIDGRDMIQTLPPAPSEGRPKPMNANTGKFKNKGFEVDATYNFLKNWQIYAGYSYLYSDNQKILYAPENKLDVSLTFSPGNFEITAESNTIRGLNNGSPDGKVNYSLLNLRGSYTWPLMVSLTLFAKIDNLLAEKYEVVYGYPMPGATAFIGLECKF